MEIKSKEIRILDLISLIDNPIKKIEILKTSKNLIRFMDHYCEMQAFDQENEEFFVKINYEDIEQMSQIKWRAQRNTETYVSIVATYEKSTIVQSRIILALKDGELCDHVNGDPTDNRRENLRVATHSENMRNRRSRKKGNIYKGIYFDKERERWVAQISVNGKAKTIGRFYTDKQAAIAYNQAAVENYGIFAKLNEIT